MCHPLGLQNISENYPGIPKYKKTQNLVHSTVHQCTISGQFQMLKTHPYNNYNSRWKKSCTSRDIWNSEKEQVICYINWLTGFLPSTACRWLLNPFWQSHSTILSQGTDTVHPDPGSGDRIRWLKPVMVEPWTSRSQRKAPKKKRNVLNLNPISMKLWSCHRDLSINGV